LGAVLVGRFEPNRPTSTAPKINGIGLTLAHGILTGYA